jgi:hypothetical protein
MREARFAEKAVHKFAEICRNEGRKYRNVLTWVYLVNNYTELTSSQATYIRPSGAGGAVVHQVNGFDSYCEVALIHNLAADAYYAPNVRRQFEPLVPQL